MNLSHKTFYLAGGWSSGDYDLRLAQEVVIELTRGILANDGRVLFAGQTHDAELLAAVAGEFKVPLDPERTARNLERRPAWTSELVIWSPFLQNDLPRELARLQGAGLAKVESARIRDDRGDPVEDYRRFLNEYQPEAMFLVGGEGELLRELQAFKAVQNATPLWAFASTGSEAERMSREEQFGIRAVRVDGMEVEAFEEQTRSTLRRVLSGESRHNAAGFIFPESETSPVSEAELAQVRFTLLFVQEFLSRFSTDEGEQGRPARRPVLAH